MSNSIRKRTEAEIIEYIKNHSEEGKLTKSLMDIAEHVGYSNATVHRVLKSLEEDGVVEIVAADKPTEPNTIFYKGPIKEANDIVGQGKGLLIKAREYSDEVADYIEESNRIIMKLRDEIEELHAKDASNFNTRILDRIDMPDGEHMLIMVRKDKVSGEKSEPTQEELAAKVEAEMAEKEHAVAIAYAN